MQCVNWSASHHEPLCVERLGVGYKCTCVGVLSAAQVEYPVEILYSRAVDAERSVWDLTVVSTAVSVGYQVSHSMILVDRTNKIVHAS